mmetsp:Transcript_60646/g.179842  ORF Transcript_60646/g.179842 Transcript_60646/m.179842 type:complete len:288 (+) Transcript_60646:779-1642(+)
MYKVADGLIDVPQQFHPLVRGAVPRSTSVLLSPPIESVPVHLGRLQYPLGLPAVLLGGTDHPRQVGKQFLQRGTGTIFGRTAAGPSSPSGQPRSQIQNPIQEGPSQVYRAHRPQYRARSHPPTAGAQYSIPQRPLQVRALQVRSGPLVLPGIVRPPQQEGRARGLSRKYHPFVRDASRGYAVGDRPNDARAVTTGGGVMAGDTGPGGRRAGVGRRRRRSRFDPALASSAAGRGNDAVRRQDRSSPAAARVGPLPAGDRGAEAGEHRAAVYVLFGAAPVRASQRPRPL